MWSHKRPTEDFCAICGRYTGNEKRHRCSAASWRAIDSANTRAARAEDTSEDDAPFSQPTWGQMHQDGVDILAMAR